MDKMGELLQAYNKELGPNRLYRLLDFGSYDVNGNYRSVVPFGMAYTGLDITEGPNVDVLMVSEYKSPFQDNLFDVIISGQCIEHVRNPFKAVAEMARVLKPKGRLFLTAPFVWREHKYPIDTFRYLPDGMKSLFEDSGLRTIDTFLNPANNGYGGVDCWGIATKD